MPGACRSSSTTRSRRSWPSRSSTAPTSSSTRRRSGSAATARRSAASSSTAARSTGPRRERFKADFVDPDPSYHGISYTAAFGNLAFILKLRVQGLRDIGAALSPFNAFLFLQGLETLPLRIQRHSENALAVAQWLEERDGVTWVSYPGLESHPTHKQAAKYLKGGFGGIVTFGVRGGVEAGRRLIDNVTIFSLLANVGDAKSLIIHPASTTHSQLEPEEQESTGSTPDLIRLSVGLEHVDDLIADLDRALSIAAGRRGGDGRRRPRRRGRMTLAQPRASPRRPGRDRPGATGFGTGRLETTAPRAVRPRRRDAPAGARRGLAPRRAAAGHAPQVVVIHALTGSADAAGDWWEPLIGPGRALDTDRVGVLAANLLGGRYGIDRADLGRSADRARRSARRFPASRPATRPGPSGRCSTPSASTRSRSSSAARSAGWSPSRSR